MKVGFCITHEIICDTDELMKKHNSAEHEKIWIVSENAKSKEANLTRASDGTRSQ